MLVRRVWWLGCALLFLLGAFPLAQSQAQDVKGGVRGMVRDEDFGAAVAGATVTLGDTGRTVATGQNGAFFFNEVAPGAYELTAQREGYRRSEGRKIAVNPGAVAEVDFSLVGEIVELDEFVVSQEDLVGGNATAALDIQQNLTSFANVMGADFISKLGASDVGKALAKVVGVSVIGDRYIVIRGLADRYNSVQLNSAGVPSSDPDKRAVNIDLFPGSIVRNLVTSKTFTPDLPGEATGGSINIITKGVPEKSGVKFKVSVGLNTNATGNNRFLIDPGGGTGMLGTLESRRLPEFLKTANLPKDGGDAETQKLRDQASNSLTRVMGTQRRAPGPDFSLETTVAHRGEFWGKPAGLLLGIDYRKNYSFEPDGLQARTTTQRIRVERGIDTLRSSLLLVGGVEPQPGDELKLTLFTNLAAQSRATLRYGQKDINQQDPGINDFTYRESLTYTERRLQVLQAAGRHHWDDGEISERAVLTWVAGYNLSSQDEPDHRFVESDSLNLETFTLPAVVSIPPVRRYWRELDDTRWTISTDYEYVLFKEEEKTTKAKFGFNFDYSDRDYRADSFAANVGLNNDQGYPSSSKPAAYPGATWADVFFYGNPTNASLPANQPTSGTYLFRITAEEKYHAAQILNAGYALINADLTKSFNVNLGLRVEETQIDIEASDIALLAAGGGDDLNLAVQLLPPEDRTPQNINDLNDLEKAKNNPAIQAARFVRLYETHVLPALNTKWKLTDEMNLRGAVSRTIARPSLKELAPVAFKDAESGDDFVGNSQLKISQITNYDVRFEYYPKDGGSFALNGFSKFIEDPIEKAGGTGLQQFVNAPDGVIYGFELEADRNLSFLAEELRAFSLGLNYAYIKSVVPRNQFSQSGPNRRLQGQPDYIFNFNLTYDNPEFGLSAGAFLNLTGPYLDLVGLSNVPDVYADPVTTLNVFIAFKLGKTGKLTLRANNLTTPKVTRYYDDGQRSPYEVGNTAATYSLSFEMDF
jgi:TonB-dependent receptor